MMINNDSKTLYLGVIRGQVVVMRHRLRFLYNHRLFRYVFVGGSTFILDIGTLYITHQLLGFGVALSTSIAYWVALVYNFCLIRFWTFDRKEKLGIQRHIVLYGLLVGINYFITVAFVSLVSHIMYFLFAKTIIAIAQTCWNYPIYKIVVFKK